MHKRFITAMLLALAAPALFASKSSPMGGAPASAQRSPKEDAIRAYNDGLHYRDRAWKAEKEFPTADVKRQATLQEVIRKSYEADVRSQRLAIENDPNLYQAHTELGYALRKTGDYAGALASYDRALQITPNFAEAIEYRAEAYLGLNRIADAQAAYLVLFNGGDHERSQLLADAMQKWVTARKTDPAGATPASVEEFSKWLSTRTEIAAHAGGSSTGGTWK